MEVKSYSTLMGSKVAFFVRNAAHDKIVKTILYEGVISFQTSSYKRDEKLVNHLRTHCGVASDLQSLILTCFG